MNAVPKFSTIQQVLKRAFFPRDRTITIYTEDKPSDRHLYSIILDRLPLTNITINSIIPLGPKSKVIESSIRSRGATNNSLFIVDSDIGLMHEKPIEDSNIIGLRKYCIENYLCCEHGIIDYLYPKVGKEKSEIKDDIKFKSEVKSNLCPIVKLYYRYLLSFKLSCGCTFRKYDYFLKGNEPNRIIDKTIISQEILEVETIIKTKLKESGIRAFAKEMKERLKEIEENNPANEEIALKVLSGKYQIFPMVRELIIRNDSTSRHLSNDQLKRLLAERFDIAQINFLKDKIVEIAN